MRKVGKTQVSCSHSAASKLLRVVRCMALKASHKRLALTARPDWQIRKYPFHLTTLAISSRIIQRTPHVSKFLEDFQPLHPFWRHISKRSFTSNPNEIHWYLPLTRPYVFLEKQLGCISLSPRTDMPQHRYQNAKRNIMILIKAGTIYTFPLDSDK